MQFKKEIDTVFEYAQRVKQFLKYLGKVQVALFIPNNYSHIGIQVFAISSEFKILKCKRMNGWTDRQATDGHFFNGTDPKNVLTAQ